MQGGFSIAELMVVVAIIAILSLIAFVSVARYLTDMTYLRNCEAAREIFIAAQNNIGDLEASGSWTVHQDVFAPELSNDSLPSSSAPKGQANSPVAAGCPMVSNDNRRYFVVGNGSGACIDSLLPVGSIEAGTWQGQYVIEYDYDAGTVCSVFYAEQDKNASAGDSSILKYYTCGDSGIRTEAVLKSKQNGCPVVGYADASSIGDMKTVNLEKPVVSVDSTCISVCDPNRAVSSLANLDTFQIVTVSAVDDPHTSLVIRLGVAASGGGLAPSMQVYEKRLVDPAAEEFQYVLAFDGSGDADAVASICTLEKAEGSTAPNVYSINMTALQNAIRSNGGDGINSGTQIVVESRCSTSHAYCRSSYGYALGMWRTGEPVIFGANILNSNVAKDYIRLNLNEEGRVFKADGSSDNSFVFYLRNYFDGDTISRSPISYKMEILGDNAGRIAATSVVGLPVDTRQVEETLSASDGYYRMVYANHQEDHRVTVTFGSLSGLTSPTLVPLRFTAYSQVDSKGLPVKDKDGNFVEDPRIITLYLVLCPASHTTASSPATWYIKDSSGSPYAELVIQTGSQELTGAKIFLSNGAKVVIDSTDDDLLAGGVSNAQAALKPIAPQTAVSVKFLKSSPNASYAVEGPVSFNGAAEKGGITWRVGR